MVIKRNEKLVRLLDKIAEMELAGLARDNTIYAFGDAYEYLMSMYASNAGKSDRAHYYGYKSVSKGTINFKGRPIRLLKSIAKFH
jgi:hypothetical protein